MNMDVMEKRQYSRVAMPSSISEGTPPGDPLIINLSHGGACLWFSDPPVRERGLALQFRSGGQDRVLPSRAVWSRPNCVATSDRENPALTDGWLVGFAFAKGDADTLVPDISHEMLGSRHITVTCLDEDHAADNWQKKAGGTSGLITFSEQSILGVKAAAKELLPVLAKHFTDVHMVFARDRLEISAPFRLPAELNPPEARRRDSRVIQASPAAHPPTPLRIEQPAALVQPNAARVMGGRWRVVVMGGASLIAVALGGTFLGVFHAPLPARAALYVPVAGQSIPAWAAGIDQTSLDGWIEVQKKFDLPDATVRLAIQVLRTNDKYSPGQYLHDLTSYPAQVKRAFSLLAGVQNGASFNFGPLENDLKGRTRAGVRFPDEAPGGAYSSLERESFNNLVVLTTIELLQRRQNDPGVKEILAALWRGRVN